MPRGAEAALPEIHWSQIPDPAPGFRFQALDGEALVGIDQHGIVWRWDGAEWESLPDPGDGWAPVHLTVQSEGVYWTDIAYSAGIRRYDGGWMPLEYLPLDYFHRVYFARDGTPWLGGVHGTVARFTDGGWKKLDTALLDDSTASNILQMTFDASGIVWMVGQDNRVLRYDGVDMHRVLDRDDPPVRVALDRQGRPLLLRRQVTRLDTEPPEVLFDRPVSAVHQGEEGWWVLSEGELWHGDVGALEWFPTPSSRGIDGLAVTPSGVVYLIESEGRIWKSVPGQASIYRDVAPDWGVSEVGDRGGIWAADFDRDGRDDLLVASNEGRARLLLQEDDTFRDVSREWNLSLNIQGPEVCVADLDGNGQPDIVARETIQRAEKSEARLRYLRTLGSRFRDASPRDVAPAVVKGASGVIGCEDVDGDGDLDVLITSGPTPLETDPKVALYENVRFGHLVRAPLAMRGLGGCGRFVQQVLAGDVDGNGTTDALCANVWGEGHTLLLRAPDGTVRNATAGSSLDAFYGRTERAWLEDVDGDDREDLVVVERWRGPRAWRNDGEGRFTDHTAAWNLDWTGRWYGRYLDSSLMEDLDGDGHLDLLIGTRAMPQALLLGTAEGPFRDMSEILPLERDRNTGAAVLDLGGDGDPDLFIKRRGADLLLENLASPSTSATGRNAGSPSLLSSVLRRLAWVRAAPDCVYLFGVYFAWIVFLPRLRARREELRGLREARHEGPVPMARWPERFAVAGILSALAFLWLASVEWDLLSRLGLILLSTVLAVASLFIGLWRESEAQAPVVGNHPLLRILDSGGMGTVYLTRHRSSLAAIKILHPWRMTSGRIVARFKAEGERLEQLRFRGIVNVLARGEGTVDFGFGDPDEAPQQVAYLVMENLRGQTLSRYLRWRNQKGRGPLDEVTACVIMREVALALRPVHELEWAHLDLKPQNLFRLWNREIRIMDFGAAENLRRKPLTAADVDVTRVWGAPEQLLDGEETGADGDQSAGGTASGARSSPSGTEGEPELRTIGPAADVFAMGLILQHMLTLRPPDRELASHRAHGKPGETMAWSPELDSVLVKACQPDPGERFAGAKDFADALNAVIGIRTRPEPPMWELLRDRWLRAAEFGRLWDLLLLGGGFARLLRMGRAAEPEDLPPTEPRAPGRDSA